MYGAKMSSDLERASRMLTFPARRGMITLMTYIGGSAIMYPHRYRFYPRERQSMQIKELAKRTTNLLLCFLIPIRVTCQRGIICRYQAREVTHNFGLSHMFDLNFLLYF